jgi:hypothetical protein
MRAIAFLLFATLSTSHAQPLVGDGVADDTAALQKLIDTGGSVHLAKGAYRLTATLTVDLEKTGFVAFTGDGTPRLLMEGEGPAIHFIGTHGGSADPGTVKPNVWEHQRAPMVEGIEIVGANEAADGIEATGTIQLTLRAVIVRECRHAVHLTKRNRNLIIETCHFYHNKGIGVFYDHVDLHQSNIVGSHISYNGGGGVVSVGGYVRNLQIGTCDIEANHARNGAPAANVMLDCTGGSIGEVTITGCTLQHSNKAPGSANIRILGAGTDPGLARRNLPTATREGNVTITGNVFSDVQFNIEIHDARDVTITGNTFWEGFEHDMLVTDSTNVVVTGNNFDRNPRYLINGFEGAEKNGLMFQRCGDCIISDNLISGVWKKRAALDIEDSRRLHVTGNSILDSDGVALRLEKVTASIITGNLLRDDRDEARRSKEPSLRVLDCRDNTVESNQLGNGRDDK